MLFCPILNDDCNHACAFKTDSSCGLMHVVGMAEDIGAIKSETAKQRNLLEVFDTRLQCIQTAQDELLQLVRSLKSQYEHNTY